MKFNTVEEALDELRAGKIIHIRAAWAALFCWGDLLQSVLVNAVCTESVEKHQVPLRDSTREIFFACNFFCYCTSL